MHRSLPKLLSETAPRGQVFLSDKPFCPERYRRGPTTPVNGGACGARCALQRFDVRQVPYGPDAGASQPDRARAWARVGRAGRPRSHREEGVALLAGACRRAQRGLLLMQSRRRRHLP